MNIWMFWKFHFQYAYSIWKWVIRNFGYSRWFKYVFLNIEYVMHLAKNNWSSAFTQDTGGGQCLCGSAVHTGMITANDKHHDVAAIMMSIFKCVLVSAVGTHVTMLVYCMHLRHTFLTSTLPYHLQPHPCKMCMISLDCTAAVCQEQLNLLWYITNIYNIAC